MEQTTVVQVITPSMAKSMLENNKANRPISKSDVSRYARDMKSGNWVLTHQGILVGKDGALIDGQHRLMAVVTSGVALKFSVTYDENVSTPLELPLDTGRKRSGHVSLGVPKSLSAVSNVAFRLVTSKASPTLSELKKFVDLIHPYHDILSKRTRKGIGSGVTLAAIVQIMRGKDMDYVVDTYAGLVGNYKTLFPYPASFFNQVVVDRVQMDTYESFARAIRAFDPDNRHKSKALVKCRDTAVSEAIEITKATILPLLND